MLYLRSDLDVVPRKIPWSVGSDVGVPATPRSPLPVCFLRPNNALPEDRGHCLLANLVGLSTALSGFYGTLPIHYTILFHENKTQSTSLLTCR